MELKRKLLQYPKNREHGLTFLATLARAVHLCVCNVQPEVASHAHTNSSSSLHLFVVGDAIEGLELPKRLKLKTPQ
jgi:hypothetical protein